MIDNRGTTPDFVAVSSPVEFVGELAMGIVFEGANRQIERTQNLVTLPRHVSSNANEAR